MAKQRRIAIVTRMNNTNAGNEALSTELIKLTAELDPSAQLMVIDRYPRYFDHLKLSLLKPSAGSIAPAFDTLARLLIRDFYSDSVPLPPSANETMVKLKSSVEELPPLVRKIKNFVGVRRNLARVGLIGREEVTSTVSLCCRVDLVIWNPAGEFHPTGDPDQTFRLLLMIRMAQLMNAATAIVNHSLELSDDLLQEVVGHVYRNSTHICVRDPQSLKVVRSLGVPARVVSEAPDLVFLAARRPPSLYSGAGEIPEGAIGLAINAAEARRGSDEWHSLIAKLRSYNRPLVFVSNAMNGDVAFGAALMTRVDGVVVGRQPSYLELREMYRTMTVLVSSRLHASILSLCADTPVVTLEPSVFKLSAIFEQLNYPIPTDTTSKAGWSDRVARHVEVAIRDRMTLVELARKALDRQVREIYTRYRTICTATTVDSQSLEASPELN